MNRLPVNCSPIKFFTIIFLSFLVVALPSHFVFAQNAESFQQSTGISSDIGVLIINVVVGPLLVTATGFYFTGRNKEQENQWTLAAESRQQLLQDRNDAVAEMLAKDKECDELRNKITELIKEISQKDSRIAILTYRLQGYEPVTGEVPKEQ